MTLVPDDRCTGCMACVDACEKSAIDVIERKGFLYPVIDNDKCTQCGCCQRTCPAMSLQMKNVKCVEEAECYVAWHQDKEVRKESSSGGVFSALATQILAEGGVVFGAAFDSQMRLRHQAYDNGTNMDQLRRSKYVQTDARGCYRAVKKLLQQDRKVLFCGTPCMIAALDQYLGSVRSDKLVAVSLACHGVPSPIIFAHYLSWLENKFDDQILDFNCRTKRYGWACGGFPIVTFKRQKRKTLILENNFFLRAFIRFHHFIRPSCKDCPFRCSSSSADLTLADFWGIQHYLPLSHIRQKELGFSGVLVYSEVGKIMLRANTECIYVPQPVHALLRHNTGFGKRKTPLGLDADVFLTNFIKDKTCSFMDGIAPISLPERMRTVERLALKSPYSPVSQAVISVYRLLKKCVSKYADTAED